MIVKDLKSNPAGQRRKSTRKHEVVRTPKARNAIVKDPMSGLYTAAVDGPELADALNSIHLRLNAIELNQSRLVRDGIADAAPAPQLPSNVVPMSVARKAKEQSKAAPVSQPGNEAEVQVLPSPEPVILDVVETPVFKGDTEPRIIGKLDDTSSIAANDSLLPDETEGLLERLADVYDMDIVDASRILHKEAEKRNRACIKKHGMPLKDVRADRYLAQKGIVETNPALQVWIKGESSGFRAWSVGMWQRECELTFMRPAPSPRGWGKLTKGEQAYRKKMVLHRAAARPKGNIPGLIKVNAIAKKLYVDGPGVTTHSQLEAIKTWGYGVYQHGRKLLGMQPTVRGARLSARYEVHDAITNPSTGDTVRDKTTAELFRAAPPLEKQADVVRRYHRTGGGY